MTKIEVRDTIITDEYSVMTKTDDFNKIAKKVFESPTGLVIVKGRDNKILGVVTYKEIIDLYLNKKDLSKVKLKDVIQDNIMKIKDTDNIEKIIKRIKRRKPIATVVENKKGQLVGYFSDSDLNYANACVKIIKTFLK